MSYANEFLFDGEPVGIFEQMPRSSGRYRYEPYRGSGHYEMRTLLRSGGSPRCYYDSDAERVAFTVRDCPQYGVLELCNFETSPKEPGATGELNTVAEPRGMSTHDDQAANWHLLVAHYGEREYHDLTREALKALIELEWKREFNGLFVTRDEEGSGQLYAFYRANQAYVAFEDYDHQQWRCSYDLAACRRPDWDENVCLTPEGSQEYVFRRCSVVTKEDAKRIVDSYLTTGNLTDLYLSGPDGKPVGASPGPQAS